MKNIIQVITLATTLAALTPSSFAQQVEDSSPAARANKLYSEKKYKEALTLYDKALKEAKSDTPEHILENRLMIARKAWIYRMLRHPAKASEMYKQCYEYSSDAAKKFPENPKIALAQVQDLSSLARDYRKPQDSKKKLTLQIQAVALADALAAKQPEDQSVLYTQFTTKNDLAKSYRWTKGQRDKSLALADDGMAILDKIDAKSLPKGTTKEYLINNILSLKVAVLILKKENQAALKLNTKLLKKIEPMLKSDQIMAYHISNILNSYYNQALLHEKLGNKKEAQAGLQNLLDIIDKGLVKFPGNASLLRSKKVYEKYKGKEIK